MIIQWTPEYPDSVINIRLEVESRAEISSVFTVKKRGLLKKKWKSLMNSKTNVEVDVSGCYDNHPVCLLLCCITAAYGARAVL